MTQLLHAGKQRIRLDDEGIVVLHITGTVLADEAALFQAVIRKHQDTWKAVTLIVDFADGEGIEAAARKIIIDGVNTRPYAVCFVGASFVIQAVTKLMVNASAILGAKYPHHFCNTEAEARAWAKSLAGHGGA